MYVHDRNEARARRAARRATVHSKFIWLQLVMLASYFVVTALRGTPPFTAALYASAMAALIVLTATVIYGAELDRQLRALRRA